MKMKDIVEAFMDGDLIEAKKGPAGDPASGTEGVGPTVCGACRGPLGSCGCGARTPRA